MTFLFSSTNDIFCSKSSIIFFNLFICSSLFKSFSFFSCWFFSVFNLFILFFNLLFSIFNSSICFFNKEFSLLLNCSFNKLKSFTILFILKSILLFICFLSSISFCSFSNNLFSNAGILLFIILNNSSILFLVN